MVQVTDQAPLPLSDSTAASTTCTSRRMSISVFFETHTACGKKTDHPTLATTTPIVDRVIRLHVLHGRETA